METRWQGVTSPIQFSYWRDFPSDIEVPDDFLTIIGERGNYHPDLSTDQQLIKRFSFFRAHGETHFWNNAFDPAWQQVPEEQAAAMLNRYWANDLLGLLDRMEKNVRSTSDGLEITLTLPAEAAQDRILLSWFTDCQTKPRRIYRGQVQRLEGHGEARATAQGVLTSVELLLTGEFLPQGEDTPRPFYLTIYFGVSKQDGETTIDLPQISPENSPNILVIPLPQRAKWISQMGDPLVGLMAEYWVEDSTQRVLNFFRQEWPKQGFTLVNEEQGEYYDSDMWTFTYRDGDNRPVEVQVLHTPGDPTVMVTLKASGGVFSFTPTVDSRSPEGFSAAFCRVLGGQPQTDGTCQWPDGASCSLADLWQSGACDSVDERAWVLLETPYLYCLIHGGTPEYTQEGDVQTLLCRFAGKEAYCDALDYMKQACQRGGGTAQALPINLQRYTAQVEGQVAAGDVVRYTVPNPEYPEVPWVMRTSGGGGYLPLWFEVLVLWLESPADDVRVDIYRKDNRLAGQVWANTGPGAMYVFREGETPLIEVLGGAQDAAFTLHVGWAGGLGESNGVNTVNDRLDAQGLRFYTQYTTSGRLDVRVEGDVVLGVYQISPTTEDWVLLHPDEGRQDFSLKADPGTQVLLVVQGKPHASFTLTIQTYLP